MPQHPPAKPLGEPFIELALVDSTNNYALELAHAGMAQHGMALFAHEQAAGKGQRGRSWNSEKNANIILSVITNPGSLPIQHQFQLSACTAVTLHEFFVRHAGDATRIKWPNDLYWHDRKAGGILIENIVSAGKKPGWQWSIIGIGININQVSFPAGLTNPVSLKQISGRYFDPVTLAKELCAILNKNFNALLKEGFDPFFRYYQDHLYKKGEPIKLKKGNRIFETLLKSVSTSGQLVTGNELEERFEFGEIDWLI